MGKIMVIICGLIMMAGGIYLAAFVWWREFYELVFGSIPILLFFIGLIAFVAGISSIKDAMRAKNLDKEAVAEALDKESPEEEEKETEEM